MIQKTIRKWLGVPYTNAEADELTQELNDRTKSTQANYNSVDELATKVKAVETDAMSKTVYDTNDNGQVDDSDKLGGLNPSFYDQQSQLDTHTGDTDIHLSTDERAAIDGTPTPPTAGNTFATQADISASGNGDMLISVYGGSDANTVDNSDKLDGQLPSVYNQSAHAADITTNPHAVTKALVGLGNVDNTTDADKPISTAGATKNSTQDSAIALNTAKTGITTQQATDITTNNAKISYTDAAIVAKAILSDTTSAGGGTALTNMVEITQAAYDLLTPDVNTWYFING